MKFDYYQPDGSKWDTISYVSGLTAKNTSEMAGVSEFSSSLRGLLRGTKYYVRAYGVNDEGTGYGNEVTFTTLP